MGEEGNYNKLLICSLRNVLCIKVTESRVTLFEHVAHTENNTNTYTDRIKYFLNEHCSQHSGQLPPLNVCKYGTAPSGSIAGSS
jgi:hypothetical protein